MGIERFFNAISRRYPTAVSDLGPSPLPQRHLLVDFNSIVHTVSAGVIHEMVQALQALHRSRAGTATEADALVATQVGAKHKVSTESVDGFLSSLDMDELIIAQVQAELDWMGSMFRTSPSTFLAVDGTPLFAKMLEQRQRRLLGDVLQRCRELMLEHYRSDLDRPANAAAGITFNQFEFEKDVNAHLRWNKTRISPGTLFMRRLSAALSKRGGTSVSDDQAPGEGEHKIMHRLRALDPDESVVVFSPDADVILLLLLESRRHRHITMWRYNQQQRKHQLIDIGRLRRELLTAVKDDDKGEVDAVREIVIIFTIFGDDFLPKIDAVDVARDMELVIQAYADARLAAGGRGLLKQTGNGAGGTTIDWEVFLAIFRRVAGQRNSMRARRRIDIPHVSPLGNFNPNAVPYYANLHELENLTGRYKPVDDPQTLVQELQSLDKKRMVQKYLQGMVWLTEYYVNHRDDYKLWYYTYKLAPEPARIVRFLEKHIADLDFGPTLVRYIPPDGQYFTPVTQLAYITNSDIRTIVDPEQVPAELWDNLGRAVHSGLLDTLEIGRDGTINLFDVIDCSFKVFISKCHPKGAPLPPTFAQFMRLLQAPDAPHPAGHGHGSAV